MKLLRHLPNTLTLCNLMCGCVAVVLLLNGHEKAVPFLVMGGACFDLADGLVARLLRAQSKIGKELDSLADMVTFGLVPGLVLWRMVDTPQPRR